MYAIRVGFVPLHREVFDEEWAVELRKRTIKALSVIKGLELVVPDEDLTRNGLVRCEEDAENVIRLFEDRKVSGVMLGTMTFGDEISAIRFGEAFPKHPILLFGTKEGPFTPDGRRKSDSFCGTLSVSSGLYRRGIPFLFAGMVFPEEEEFLTAVENFVKTCSIINGFHGARIGLIGPRPETFETCAFNEVALMNNFQQRIVQVSLAHVFAVADGLGDREAEVLKIVEQMKRQSDTSLVSEETLRKMAKLELVLRRIAEEKKLAAMGVRCWTEMQEVYGISPCYVMGRLTETGIMSSCEVDVHGALTMLIQYLASLRSALPHFIDWTIQHQERENVFLAWHCGNAPPSLCEGARIVLRDQSVLGRVLGLERSQGTAEFQVRPGEVTICRLVEYDGKFKMLITSGRIVRSEEELRGSWSWVEVQDLDKLYRTLVEEGFIHHASMVHGDHVEPIKDACKLLGIEAVIV